MLIYNSLDRIRTPKGREERVHAQMALSRCVPLREYGISEEADVVAVATRIEGNFEGLVSSGLVGRVFNRGKKTARNVVVRYWVRTASGTNVTQGEILVVPEDLPGLAFGRFRGRIGAIEVTADHVVSVEIHWGKGESSSSSSAN